MYSTIPLNNVKVNANILDGIAKVSLICNFKNINNFVVTPIHFFSLDSNATINNLEMKIGNRLLKSSIKEKVQAQKEFSIATTSGYKSSILEKLSENEFKLSMSNLNPNETASIIIEYISILDCNSNGSYTFVFPTNIGVKYLSDSKTNADKLFAKEISQLTYSNVIFYDYNFNIVWESSQNILGFEAPSEYCEIEHSDKKIIIKSKSEPHSGDFTIALKINHAPRVYFHENCTNNELYMLATLRIDKPDVIPEKLLQKDYKLVVDCSGSMSDKFGSGTKISETQKALLQFINLLNDGDYFNITKFGSTFESMLEASIKVTNESKIFARNYISKINSDMGGTELYDCLETQILNSSDVDNEECEKIIVLFTDGQIGNYVNLTNFVEKYYNFSNDFYLAMSTIQTDQEEVSKMNINNRFRIFTIGMGNDVDRKLIKKLADITGGLYIFVKDYVNIDNALNHMISNINSKYYINARLDVLDDCENVNLNLYPNKNYFFVRKIQLSQKAQLQQNGLTLLCTNSKTNANVRLNMKFDKFQSYGPELMQFYHNIVIKNLEHQLEFSELSYDTYKQLLQKLIKLSVDHNIMSKYTSFLITDDVRTSYSPSININIPHYSANHVVLANNSIKLEEVDCLDGGMDMFGGGGGSYSYTVRNENFTPYVTKIERQMIIDSLNLAGVGKLMQPIYHNVCILTSEDLTLMASKLNLNVIITYNIIICFEMLNYFELKNHAYQLLKTIVINNTNLTPRKCFALIYEYNKYISDLNKENAKNMYITCTSCNGWGGDY